MSGRASTGHTPGPWLASGIPHATLIRAGCPSTGRRIASTWVQDSASAKGAVINEANARLIAAAPELLEALESLMAHRPNYADTLWQNADEAIAKAKGHD